MFSSWRVTPVAGAALGALLPALALSAACRTTTRKPEAAGVPGAPSSPILVPETHEQEDPQLVVKRVTEQIVVAAWAEPRALPEGGGQAQLLVRIQRRGGAAFPGVEVRFKTSKGSLYSGGKVLVTDKLGLTRDRLTTKKTASITLNAGGTRYTFQVPVNE
ncbi:MAG TPA: hypothetical protein VI589_09270 [Vicinamibacteria bacterium]